MSASPETLRRTHEELDLLLSRSLDGDLAPDEERELAEILASDPRAARRREELAVLVGKLGALPAPAAPLGLTARVGARAADQAKGLGGVWRRLGIFPPPAMVRGVAALFVIVMIGISVLRNQSARQKAAEEAVTRDEGRVAVILGEKKQTAPVSPPAAAPRAAEPDSKAKVAAVKEEGQPARVAGRPAEPSIAPSMARQNGRREGEVAAAQVAKDATGGGAGFASEVPASREDNPEAAGAVRSEAARRSSMAAPAPPAQARAKRDAPLAWDVEVVGPSARAWALRRIAAPPPSASGMSGTYRLRLGADGEVLSIRAVEGAAPETDALVKSLVFTPLGPDPPAEIDVTVRSR